MLEPKNYIHSCIHSDTNTHLNIHGVRFCIVSWFEQWQVRCELPTAHMASAVFFLRRYTLLFLMVSWRTQGQTWFGYKLSQSYYHLLLQPYHHYSLSITDYFAGGVTLIVPNSCEVSQSQDTGIETGG